MKDWINQQFGRILLGAAIAITAVASHLQAPPAPPASFSAEAPGSLQVKLDVKALEAASSEKYFPPGKGADYMGGERFVFVPEKKVRVYEKVELDLPLTSVMAAPTVLPEPGPTLQGAHDLPRMEKFLNAPAPDNSADRKPARAP
jgi:hypothetical protein